MTNEFRVMVVRRAIADLQTIGFTIEKLSAPPQTLVEIEAEAIVVQKITMKQKAAPHPNLVRLLKEQGRTFAGIPLEAQALNSEHEPSRHLGDCRQAQR